jgi:RNA polymerase sigma factor (TIGR02999 family)
MPTHVPRSALPSDAHLITQVLAAVSRNEPRAAEELLPLVYDELRRLARSRLDRVGPGQTLQATALVHEAWLRVVGSEDPGWDGRAHFFGAAAKAMRNILVEQARRKARLKRGGQRGRLEADVLERIGNAVPLQSMLILDEALERLEAQDARKAEIVALRFFTGLSMREVAEVLDLPLSRVEQEWRFARAWLQREVEAFEGCETALDALGEDVG